MQVKINITTYLTYFSDNWNIHIYKRKISFKVNALPSTHMRPSGPVTSWKPFIKHHIHTWTKPTMKRIPSRTIKIQLKISSFWLVPSFKTCWNVLVEENMWTLTVQNTKVMPILLPQTQKPLFYQRKCFSQFNQ